MSSESPGCLLVAGVILAAGAATRMGSLKQLLSYAGETLIGHVIDTALEAALGPVIVVVGAEADAVQDAIAFKNVEVVRNAAWRSGMGSSLSAGILRLQEIEPDSAGAAVLLADQPLVTAEHISGMRRLLHTSGAHAVAADYDGSLGVPAIFGRRMFTRLAALPPEAGAKQLLLAADIKVARFPLPEAATDVDTPADFERLCS